MNKATTLKPIPDSRRFKRASVALQGALRIPKFGVEIIQTENISEGGIGLQTADPCPISKGDDVQLHLNGIISSSESTRLDTYSMKVMHVDGTHIGLAFA